ncbi:MAG: hypothetical protein IPP35_11620 [Elusimicrobia bacterium]|nr:hypothetical protein [Elusimicrobiota bacterium]
MRRNRAAGSRFRSLWAGSVLFHVCVGLRLFAAFEGKPFSARSAALGESLVGATVGLDAAHENPASLAFSERSGVSFAHARLFGENDLPMNSIGGVFRTEHRGGFGGFLTDFGSSLYREREMGLSWGGRLADRAGLGVTLKRQDLTMDRYGGFGAYQVDVGVFGRLLPVLSAGITVKNLTQSPLGGTPEAPPAIFSAGASLDLLARGSTSLAVVQESSGRVSWRAGQEAWLHPAFALRAGFETGPNRFALGMGFLRPLFALDYAFLTHSTLPDQHQFTFSFFFRGS